MKMTLKIPPKTTKLRLWTNSLMEHEFDENGKLVGSKLMRSFTVPAKDSAVKKITKPKKEKIVAQKTIIEIDDEEVY